MRAVPVLFPLLASLLLSGGCMPTPKQNYSIEQIPQIESLGEIMKVQAQAMDPLFKKRDRASFSKEEFGAMADAARRVQATSATVRDRFSTGRKPSFQTYAGDLNRQAGELLAAAEAGDAGRAAGALREARATCRGCHRENR